MVADEPGVSSSAAAQVAPPTPAPAPAPVAQPAPARGGPWIHLEIGPGTVKYEQGSGAYTARGVGLALGAAVGGFVSRHVVVYGALAGTFASGPEIDSFGTVYQASADRTISMRSIGVGVLYVSDTNLHLGGGIMRGRAIAEDDFVTNDRTLDAGLSLRGGKEWRRGQHMSLGVSVRIEIGSGTQRDRPDASESSLALLFSGSYR